MLFVSTLTTTDTERLLQAGRLGYRNRSRYWRQGSAHNFKGDGFAA
jgi:hypothetical protein